MVCFLIFLPLLQSYDLFIINNLHLRVLVCPAMRFYLPSSRIYMIDYLSRYYYVCYNKLQLISSCPKLPGLLLHDPQRNHLHWNTSSKHFSTTSSIRFSIELIDFRPCTSTQYTLQRWERWKGWERWH